MRHWWRCSLALGALVALYVEMDNHAAFEPARWLGAYVASSFAATPFVLLALWIAERLTARATRRQRDISNF